MKRWLLALSFIWLVDGCVTVPPQPPAPEPTPTLATLAIVVSDANGPLEGADLARSDGQRGRTNRDGYFAWDETPFAEYVVEVSKEGYTCGTAGGAFEHNTDWSVTCERPRAPARRGLVRAMNHAVADDGGPFNPLGVTLFWAAWGYKFDPGRLNRNLASIRELGADYIRVLGSVGGRSWVDRPVETTWPDYDQVIAGLTDHAYDQYGLRITWTIFGGSPDTADAMVRAVTVDRFARMAVGREHKIFAFEIGNEAWKNSFRGNDGLAELRQLGRRLADQVPILVALSDASGYMTGHCGAYAGAGVDAATMHYERVFKADGAWRPVRQPWGYPDEYYGACHGQLPDIVFNNEPIGPQSSVAEDHSPSRLAAAYITTFVARNSGYVFHAGPGIRGGGAADLARGRSANYDELPQWAETVGAVKAAKSILPAGLANWTKHNAQWSSAPFDGFARAVDNGSIIRAYAVTNGSDFLVIILGLVRPVAARSRAAVEFDVIHPTTGAIAAHHTLNAGESFELAGADVFVLKGTRR